ncbi:MAG: hypothetical protein LC753_06415 [Acidobacteria bacterium]|nr:hypothetical protein [Acidobacteriota bacterium]MCA1649923.1 hypothetical protein [Acidobacteriota bacterium]
MDEDLAPDNLCASSSRGTRRRQPPAVLSQDTDSETERIQIEIWRGMSPLQKARLVSDATRVAHALALAGIRHRHPAASERECFLRLAVLQMGPELVRAVYPDAADLLGL